MRKLKLYVDACCLNRPFDDLKHDVVRLEAAAVEAILSRCEDGEWDLVSGELLRAELREIRDPDRKQAVLAFESMHAHSVPVDDEIVDRARVLGQSGISAKDAVHLASAEKAGVDFFVSTDYRLLKKAQLLDLTFESVNPLELVALELTE